MGTPIEDNITAGKYINHFTYHYRDEDLERYKQYIQENARLIHLFRSDLEEEFGVSGHLKATLLFQKALNYGFAKGFGEVYYHYANLVDLIQ